MPRSERLRLSLDAKYPAIVAEAEALLRRVFPVCRVGRVIADGGSTVVLWVYHRHLSCLGIFSGTCAALGLQPRQYGDRVRLCRRADVAELMTHVGVKC
jgi:hypothetical protein